MEELKPAPQPPRVSVVVVSYNCVDALRRCLAALERSKERESIEVLVADNGSTDGSAELDSEFPAVNYLRMPKNFGLTKALNIATRTATGEWMFFLSPYIEVKPETVATLLARVAEDASVGAVCPMIVDGAGEPSMDLWPLPDSAALGVAAWGGELRRTPVDRTCGGEMTAEYASLEALMVTRYFVRGMNFFDERYGQFWQDAELAFQLRRTQKKLVVLTRVEVLRMTDFPPPMILSQAGVVGALQADRALGACVYAGKHLGFFTGLRLRLGAIFAALGAALAFRAGGFTRLMAVVSGQVVDGNQVEF